MKKKKQIVNASPTTVDNIKFKSGLEAYCYLQLKHNSIKADYEGKTFTLIDEFFYNNKKIRKMTYTPDFIGKNFIIECKGRANESFPLRWKIFQRYLYDNRIKYNLYKPSTKKEIDSMIVNILNTKNNGNKTKMAVKRSRKSTM